MVDSGKTDEGRVITYLAPGQAPDVERPDPILDPELAKIRDREAEALAKVEIDTAPQEPTIDPELVKIRDEQIKREQKLAGVTSSDATATTDSGTAKKHAAKKSAKK